MSKYLQISLLSASAAILAGSVLADETHVGATVDSRVVLGFAVAEDAAQGMLPDGWKILTLPRGPLAGTNLVMVLIDRHLDMGPDMKAGEPATSRSAVLASYGVQAGQPAPRLFVTRIYSTDDEHDPYGVALPAAISRTHTLSGGAEGAATRSEDWAIAPEAGGSITITYDHTAGTPVWSEGESLNYSAANPDFYRIYRYSQIDDLAMSEALDKPITGEISVTVDVPELAAMFNGSERITAVISRPVYIRDTYLP